ncbi:hypothetical protein VKT23_013340 [Stygiomarasmius scandens]|uniref:Uncharacterized protein n=1 Tax=Marasmiellus scandens TaxID=2682957 RepID=A0ABR1J5S9_9AGAR
MSPQLVWIITGTSSGFGRELALVALARGDRVIATARQRSLHKIEDLKTKGAETLELEVTAPLDVLKETAKKAVGIYGKVDVVVNNAGYVLSGPIEEKTPEESFQQFNTNVFGGLNVARAFLPYMRERKTGTIVWLGSLSGWAISPLAALYSATKAAVRQISESLHEEVASFGLRSVCIDPGMFRTAFLSDGNRSKFEVRIKDYEETTRKQEEWLASSNYKQLGDPVKCVQIIADIVRGEGIAKDKPFPTNLQLGSDCYKVAKDTAERTLRNLQDWEEVILSTDHKN